MKHEQHERRSTPFDTGKDSSIADQPQAAEPRATAEEVAELMAMRESQPFAFYVYSQDAKYRDALAAEGFVEINGRVIPGTAAAHQTEVSSSAAAETSADRSQADGAMANDVQAHDPDESIETAALTDSAMADGAMANEWFGASAVPAASARNAEPQRLEPRSLHPK